MSEKLRAAAGLAVYLAGAAITAWMLDVGARGGWAALWWIVLLWMLAEATERPPFAPPQRLWSSKQEEESE